MSRTRRLPPAAVAAGLLITASATLGNDPAAERAAEGRADRAAAAAVPLDVVSFNMQHRDKPSELEAMARRLEQDLPRLPDFILCQEVLFQRSESRGEDNTAAVLAEELGYRCHGTKRRSDREGVAILSRHRFVYYGQRDLEARTNGLLLGFKRVSVMGEFLVPDVGRVRVVNVHLAHWPFEHHIRRKQLRETLDWIDARQMKVHADVTVLGGDFNIKPEWSEMRLLTEPADGSVVVFQDGNTGRPTRGPRGRPSSRVDYIFVSGAGRELDILDERLLFVDGIETPGGTGRFWISDHVPLLHRYAVRPPAVAAAER